jgi:hypothetical protein
MAKRRLPRKVAVNVEKRRRFLKKLDRRYHWLAAGLICFALFPVLSFFPWFTEIVYSRGIFIPIRYLFDYTIGLTSLPAAYFMFALVGVYVAWKIFRFVRFNIRNRELSFAQRAGYSALSLGSFMGKVSVVFFLGWGFHYWRTPIEEVAGIDASPLTPQEMYVQANWERKRANEARDQIQGLEDRPFHAGVLPSPSEMEKEMREHLNTVMKYLGYPTYPGVRCKYVYEDVFLNLFGYTGVYISFFGEAQVNGHLPPVYLPFFTAHEMAHAYGFFDEATANFLAYLACEQSSNPVIRYSGRVAHLLYLWHELQFAELNIPDDIMIDLRSSGVFTSTSWYNRMIVLVNGWRKKHPLDLNDVVKRLEQDNSLQPG